MKQITVPTDLTSPILEWILNENNRNDHCFTPKMHQGTVHGIRNLNVEGSILHEEVMAIDRYVLGQYGLSTETPFDTKDGVFLSYSGEGHIVHLHRDFNPDDDTLHIRFNIMIQKPLEGGNPIIGGTTIEVEENQTWICEAGNYAHTIEEVRGDRPRVMLSLGHFINKETYNNLAIS